MTNPASQDDSWNDLYAELGLDKPAAGPADATAHAPPAPEREPLRHEVAVEEFAADTWPDEVPPSDGLVAEQPEGDEGEDEGDEAEGAEDAATADGLPGSGRKRRRRRRRRKKGGPDQPGEPGEEGVVTPLEGGVPPAPAAPTSPTYAAERTTRPAAPSRSTTTSPKPSRGRSRRETSSETLRELISTWNVPSWDEIIGGLYRPER